MISAEQSIVEHLNRHCQCVGTDIDSLRAWLDNDLRKQGILEPVVATHPHLFSQLPVFVTSEHQARMGQIIAAIESVVNLPTYRALALSNVPNISNVIPKARSVFMGYDFHISSTGPKLIEINTNAGGAMLNVAMTRAQQACCPDVAEFLRTQPDSTELEDGIFAMFMEEWHLSRDSTELRCIAIVDESPQTQYLYPEFLLFRQLFESRGVRTVIVSPEQLTYRQDALWFGAQRVDMVYNRLTDFYLQASSQAALAEAYRAGAVVLTPHPHAHALYANKKNLALLSDEQTLLSMAGPREVVDILLNGVPRTEGVNANHSDRWWNDRKKWFFKPHSGFGSRGTYRGDKLTRKTFGEIMNGGYMAQSFSPPAERWHAGDALKFDIRIYVYAGRIQQMAARLYQGQTTNFRTQGGGFAPIYAITNRFMR